MTIGIVDDLAPGSDLVLAGTGDKDAAISLELVKQLLTDLERRCVRKVAIAASALGRLRIVRVGTVRQVVRAALRRRCAPDPTLLGDCDKAAVS